MDSDRFRVSIFGSARLQEDSETYREIHDLAMMIAAEGYDIITGGGPGLMDAALKGHQEGRRDAQVQAIGLPIKLPFEASESPHAEIVVRFDRFGHRLDTFMALSDAVVVAPGGIGTALEFFYTVQLIQVRHTNPVPVILFGDMWRGLLQWLKDEPLARGLLKAEDLNNVVAVSGNDEAMRILREAQRTGGACVNLHKYPTHAAMVATSAPRGV